MRETEQRRQDDNHRSQTGDGEAKKHLKIQEDQMEREEAAPRGGECATQLSEQKAQWDEIC
jgi:hypothetical protein